MSDDKPPPVKLVLPFCVVVVIESTPKEMGGQVGYQHNARAIGKSGDTIIEAKVNKFLGWSNADYLSMLKFDLLVDASALVPFINATNNRSRDKK